MIPWKNTHSVYKMISTTALGVAALGLTLTFTAIELRAADSTSAAQSQPQVIDDSQLQALSTTVGGASVLRTTRIAGERVRVAPAVKP